MKNVNIEETFLQLTTDAMFRLRNLGLGNSNAENFLHLGHGYFPYGEG